MEVLMEERGGGAERSALTAYGRLRLRLRILFVLALICKGREVIIVIIPLHFGGSLY